MIISHVKIIAFQSSFIAHGYFILLEKTVVYIINRIIHVCSEISDLFLVLNMISHSFAALTREISRSTLEIHLVFPRIHVLFSIYIIKKISKQHTHTVVKFFHFTMYKFPTKRCKSGHPCLNYPECIRTRPPNPPGYLFRSAQTISLPKFTYKGLNFGFQASILPTSHNFTLPIP